VLLWKAARSSMQYASLYVPSSGSTTTLSFTYHLPVVKHVLTISSLREGCY
jgi:hypothetical protein